MRRLTSGAPLKLVGIRSELWDRELQVLLVAVDDSSPPTPHPPAAPPARVFEEKKPRSSRWVFEEKNTQLNLGPLRHIQTTDA